MGGFAIALGGASDPLQQYSAQQRQALESRRHDLMGLVGQALQQPGTSPEFKSTLFGLGQDLGSGKNIGPLLDKFQKAALKEQQGNTQLHQITGTMPQDNTPPPPPPGPTPSGQVAGVGGNAAVTPPVNAALPSSSPIAGGDQIKTPPPVSGTMSPGMVGVSLQNIGAPPLTPPVTAASDVAAPPPIANSVPTSLPSLPPPVATAPSVNDQFQPTPLEQMQIAQYQRELGSPWGPSARTEAAVTPVFQRMAQLAQLRGQSAVEVEKADMQFRQNLAHAKSLFGDDYAAKLAPELLSEYAATGQIKPSPILKPGDQISSLITGKPLATSTQHRLEPLQQGGELVDIPPSAATGGIPPVPGAPPATPIATGAGLPQVPGAQVIASAPPLLTPEESRSQSAALITAKKYNVPFDPNSDPRNPLKQLPPKIQVEAAQLAKRMNEDPEERESRLATQAMVRSLEGVRLQLAQGSVPTPEAMHDTAQDILSGRMAPSQLRLYSGMGPAGQAYRQGVLQEIHRANPDFNEEAAESNYNFGHSPAFQQTTRYMDYADSSIDNTIKNANVLANSGFTSYSKLKNKFGNEFQSVDLAKFNTDRLETADAIAKILQGGTGSGTSDKKLADAQGLIKESDDPAKVAATLKEVRDLIAKRKSTYAAGTYLGDRATGAVKPVSGGVTLPPPASTPIIQHSASTGLYRYSTDGGKTWQAGQPPK